MVNFLDSRFDWGSRARELSERVQKLLDKDQGRYLEQERARARSLARGIQGYGSFDQRPTNTADTRNSSMTMFSRCNSEYNNSNHNEEPGDGPYTEDDHPFNEKGHDRSAARLMSEKST